MYANNVPVIASITAHPHRLWDIDRPQFAENQLIHPPLTQPIGANQRIDRHPRCANRRAYSSAAVGASTRSTAMS